VADTGLFSESDLQTVDRENAERLLSRFRSAVWRFVVVGATAIGKDGG
jgi:hypothetical protein